MMEAGKPLSLRVDQAQAPGKKPIVLPFEGADDTVKRPRTAEDAWGLQGDDGGVAKNFEVGCTAKGVEVCCSDQGSSEVFLGGAAAAVESYIWRAKVHGMNIDLVQDRLLIRIEDLGFAPDYPFFVEMEDPWGFEHFWRLAMIGFC